MRIGNLKPLVENILRYNSATRKDDFLLINEVVKSLIKADNITLSWLSKWHKQNGIPSFESITRCRRAVQTEFPELKDIEMSEIRAEEEQKYKEEFSH